MCLAPKIMASALVTCVDLACLRRRVHFHTFAVCFSKWESKFKSNAYGFIEENSSQKKHRSYAKRKERAEAKRKLLQWRCLKITPEQLAEMPSKRNCFSKLQHLGWSFKMEKEALRFRKSYRGRVGPKDGSTSSSNFSEGSSPTSKSSQHSSWRFANSYGGQWWGHFFGKEIPERGRSNTDQGRVDNEYSFQEIIGSPSDRKILGLSPFGPLTLKDLKHAFRACALKWHPDRHEGASKAIAEEQFKSCGAAYKALYADLSSQACKE